MKYLPTTFLLFLGLFACGPKDLASPIDPVALHRRIAPVAEPIKHNLSTHHDTTVITPHGISVEVPAGAFVDVAGNPVTGDIELTLTEAFTTAEMVYQPVSTVTTDGELLASKGMVKIEASQRGQSLFLGTGKSIGLGFSDTSESFSSYQLFYGVETPEGQVEWQVDTMPVGGQQSVVSRAPPPPISFRFYSHLEMAKFPKEDYEVLMSLNDHTKFTDDEMRRYRAAGLDVRFIIFEDGEFGPHTVLGNISKAEKIKIIKRFEQLPNLKIKGRNSDIQGSFYFTIETEAEQRQREIEESSFSEFNLSVYRLGWTNCDVFLRLMLPVAEMKMIEPDDSTLVKLVFSDYKTTVSPQYGTQDSITFYNIPMGADVSVVSVTPHSEGVNMSITPTTTSRVLKELVPAEIVSKEEMVRRLNALN